MLCNGLSKRLIAATLSALCLVMLVVAGAEARRIDPGDHGEANAPTAAPHGVFGAETGCVNSDPLTGPGQKISLVKGASTRDVWAGVIYVYLHPNDGTLIPTFCTEIETFLSPGTCFQTDGPTACPITWLLNNGYGPNPSNSDDENAARQAAVWYFSDGYEITGPDGIKSRAQEIISKVPANCTIPSSAPVMTIDPSNAVNYLPGGETHTLTVNITQDGNPVANEAVNLTSDFGTLGVNQVTTGSDGRASFTISTTSSGTGTAHVGASFPYTLPIGTRFTKLDTAANQQVIVLGTSQTGSVVANVTVTWKADTLSPTAVGLTRLTATASVHGGPLWVSAGLACLVGALAVWRRGRHKQLP